MKKTNPLASLFDWIPGPLKNKYILVTLFFLFWMFFVDKHDFITQWKLQRTYVSLLEEQEELEKGILELKQAQKDLELNKEKYAREKYYMKRKNEDVYIVE